MPPPSALVRVVRTVGHALLARFTRKKIEKNESSLFDSHLPAQRHRPGVEQLSHLCVVRAQHPFFDGLCPLVHWPHLSHVALVRKQCGLLRESGPPSSRAILRHDIYICRPLFQTSGVLSSLLILWSSKHTTTGRKQSRRNLYVCVFETALTCSIKQSAQLWSACAVRGCSGPSAFSSVASARSHNGQASSCLPCIGNSGWVS